VVTENAAEAFSGAQAVLDFTTPDATVAFAQIAAEAGAVHIIGTTGFADAHLSAIAAAADRGVIIRAGNMSLGVNLLVFLFHVTGSNLRHSHVDIRYPRWLEHLLISPAQHQIHHSIAEEHYDKNFGAALAVWDWLFGSLHVSEGQHDLEFGLRDAETHSATDLRVIYLRPLREIGAQAAALPGRVKRWVVTIRGPRGQEWGRSAPGSSGSRGSGP